MTQTGKGENDTFGESDAHQVRPECHVAVVAAAAGQGKSVTCDSGQETHPGPRAWEAQEPSNELRNNKVAKIFLRTGRAEL